MPRFAANLTMMYKEHPFEERFAAASADGFDAVEYLFPYAWSAAQLQAWLQGSALVQALFNAPPGGANLAGVNRAWDEGCRGTAALPERKSQFRYGIELALEYAQALQCRQIHVMSGLVENPADRHDRHIALHWQNNLAWAAEKAAAQGCMVLVEPINAHDMPGYYLQTQAQAHAALEVIGHPYLGVQMDFYHCQRTEGDALLELRRYLPTGRIRHTQIAGSPLRQEPSLGELDYTSLMNTLDQAGWQGFVGCEYNPQGPTTAGLQWLRPWMPAGCKKA